MTLQSQIEYLQRTSSAWGDDLEEEKEAGSKKNYKNNNNNNNNNNNKKSTPHPSVKKNFTPEIAQKVNLQGHTG